MIYQFGQVRPGRRGQVIAPREEAPGEEPTGYLPAAQMIASAVGSVMDSGYGVTPTQAIRVADSQIDPAYKFYQVEFQQAATLLGQSHPAVHVNTWLMFLGNNMGYRKVVMPICRYGEVADPMTKACVPESVLIREERPVDRYVPGDERLVLDREEIPEEKPRFQMPIWGWGLGAGLVMLLFMGGRR